MFYKKLNVLHFKLYVLFNLLGGQILYTRSEIWTYGDMIYHQTRKVDCSAHMHIVRSDKIYR